MRNLDRREAIASLVGALTLPSAALAATPGPAGAAPAGGKRGGTLHMCVNTVPPSASIHEEQAISTVQPFMPVFNNLVMFDQGRRRNTADAIVPDLATAWNWSEDGTRLTFALRSGVTWHDGKPFTAADVKATWDAVTRKRQAGWRRTPRSTQFGNLVEVVADDDHTVSFELKRPQPSFLTLLATGFAPVYPAHVSGATMRRRPVGTGPFRVVNFTSDAVRLTRNPDYWKPGRPYLDAIETTVIASAATSSLAFAAGRLDILTVNLPALADLRRQRPGAVYEVDFTDSHFQLYIDRGRPPFDDARVRRAVDLTLDRQDFISVVNAGFGAMGGAMLPAPAGAWGLPAEELARLPGYGPDIEGRRAEGRSLMQAAGYGPDKPLAIPFPTRDVADFQSAAILAMDHLSRIWIKAEQKPVETAQWEALMASANWPLLMGSYGAAVDDPDVVLFDNYACGSPTNYGRYCSQEMQAKIEAQSATLDPAARLALVREIDRELQEDAVCPVLVHNARCFCHQPEVRGFATAEDGLYNDWRMEDVWLDR